MDNSHPFRSMSIGHPIPEIRLFKTSTLKLQGQGHGCGQWARLYSRISILLIHFLFISYQSEQFLRYNYFEILPWNIQGQGHEWGRRSRSYIVPSIQPMHFLFSHINRTKQSWDMAKIEFDVEKKNTSKFLLFAENNSFQQNFSKM